MIIRISKKCVNRPLLFKGKPPIGSMQNLAESSKLGQSK